MRQKKFRKSKASGSRSAETDRSERHAASLAQPPAQAPPLLPTTKLDSYHFPHAAATGSSLPPAAAPATHTHAPSSLSQLGEMPTVGEESASWEHGAAEAHPNFDALPLPLGGMHAGASEVETAGVNRPTTRESAVCAALPLLHAGAHGLHHATPSHHPEIFSAATAVQRGQVV